MKHMKKAGKAEKETSLQCDCTCITAFWTEIYLSTFNGKAEKVTVRTSHIGTETEKIIGRLRAQPNLF